MDDIMSLGRPQTAILQCVRQALVARRHIGQLARQRDDDIVQELQLSVVPSFGRIFRATPSLFVRRVRFAEEALVPGK